MAEDDLDEGARRVGHLDDGGDVRLDVRVSAGPQGADLEHHVELGRPVLERLARLRDLDLGAVVAVRKPDGRAHGDVGAGEDCCGAPDVGRAAAHRRHVVLGRQAAAVLDLSVVELGQARDV